MLQPTQKLKKKYPAPTEGRNDLLSPIMLPEEGANELQNFVVNYRGIMDKVQGYQTDGSPFPASTDSFIRMLVNYKRGNTVDKLIMAAQDNGNTNATYKVDLKETSGDGNYSYIGHTAGTSATLTSGSTAVTGVGTTWTSYLKAGDKIKLSADADTAYGEISTVNTDTSLTLTANYSGTGGTGAYIARIILDKSHIPHATVFNNKVIITNGADKPMTYDNTTVNLLTSANAPKAKFICNHKSRVFMASTTGAPSSIYWSYDNDETTWDATSVEPIFENDNGNITDIKSFADSLIILKNNGLIYQVIGDFDDTAAGTVRFIRRIDTPQNVGIITENSAVVHTDGLYFLAQTGVYRIDARLFVQKASWPMENFLQLANFSAGPSQSKSYPFTTQAQWNGGTFDGLIANASGQVRNFNDRGTITDATDPIRFAIAIDKNNVVHGVYTTTRTTYGDNLNLEYFRWDTDGTITKELIAGGDVVSNVSIAVNSDASVVGVIWSNDTLLRLCERTSGTWGSISTIQTTADGSSYRKLNPIDWQYQGTSNFYGAYRNTVNGCIYWFRRVGGVVTSTNAITLGNSNYPIIYLHNSGNPRIIYGYDQGWHSDDGGTTWSAYSSTLGERSAGGFVSGTDTYTLSSGTSAFDVTKYDLSTNTHTTVVTEATQFKTLGYINYLGNDYYCYVIGTLSAGPTTFKYLANGVSLTTTGDSAATGSTGASNPSILNYPDARNNQTFVHNGATFASCVVGQSVDNMVLRRLSFTGTWTSPVESDATLTQWGTYTVTNPVANGNTIGYGAAVSTTSSLPAQTTITNGAVVSSDSSKVFVQTTITITLTALSSISTIDGLTINYSGAGVDSKQPYGLSFNNEMYLALAKQADTSNNYVMFYDRAGKWSLLTYPVTTLCYYKNKLYAGLATKGDLIVLRQTYKFGTSAYTAEFISKEDFLDFVDQEKSFYKAYVLFEVKGAGSFTFSYRLDNFKTANGATWIDTTIDQTANSDTPGLGEVSIGNKAHSIQFKIQNANSDEQCSIIGFVVVYDGLLNQR